MATIEGRNLVKNGKASEMRLWCRRFRGARTPQVGYNDLSSASTQPAACLKSTSLHRGKAVWLDDTIHVVSYEKGQHREHDIEVDESKPDVVATTHRCDGGA